jgi:hypothetical protein
MKAVVLLAMMGCLIGSKQMKAADVRNASTAVLIELFTSEGCSSCPPADAWLQQLELSQPIAGAQLIVLSEHVDYWDHDGWKDPYSSSLLTARQSDYVHALGLSSPYTPQVIVDGKNELQLNDPQQVGQVLLKAAKAPQVPVSIGALSVEGNEPQILRAHIDVNGEEQKRNADIFAAVALNHAESQVAHGENGGKRLTHVAVVEELVKIGRLEKGKTFSKDIQIKLGHNIDSRNLRLIVFVQEPEVGSVVGAALQKSSPAGK